MILKRMVLGTANFDFYISLTHVYLKNHFKNSCVLQDVACHGMSTLDPRYNDDAPRNLFGSEVLDDYLKGHVSLGRMTRG